jgi:hypothetical protein
VTGGSLVLGLAELVIHFAIDNAKCMEKFGLDEKRAYNIDQLLHHACKVVWVCLICWFPEYVR